MANNQQGSFWPEWTGNKLFTVLLAILMVYGIVWLCLQIEKTNAQIEQIGVADQSPATITVSGEGKATAVPDKAQVDLSITTTASTSNAAQDDNSTKMNALLAELKKLGLADADLKTSQYDVSQTYDYNVSPAKVTGYQSSQTVTVTMHDTSLADKVLALAGDLGVTNISNVDLTVSDDTKVTSEARQAAINKAKAQALVIANSLGAQLGAVVNYNESTGSTPYPMYAGMAVDKSVGSAPLPQIQEGTNESTIDVSITYSLK